MLSSPSSLPTRQRILIYLAGHKTASAQTLSRAWGMTRANLQHHLAELFAEGQIERVPVEFGSAARAGRPVHHYRLPVGSAPNNLPALCSALLSAFLSGADEKSMEPRLRSVAMVMAGTSTLPDGSNQRLNQAVTSLNQKGYQSRWEASFSGPRILLHACPYASVLVDHPEICRLDRLFVEHLTGIELEQTAQMDFRTGKPAACVFSIPRYNG